MPELADSSGDEYDAEMSPTAAETFPQDKRGEKWAVSRSPKNKVTPTRVDWMTKKSFSEIHGAFCEVFELISFETESCLSSTTTKAMSILKL
ncbi:unnamed protein product [Danaus chrysippus]|uniref:(African queen) hypothetical protein n=1 Tax=Danaus chrysippus TaxID=151541 RepID=A0A8J2QR54_9NEOP|nr:unnamed protein product [Danaus chrysippus]